MLALLGLGAAAALGGRRKLKAKKAKGKTEGQ